MGQIDELLWVDATAQAKLIRQKEISALELVNAAIERIEQLNPKLNAVITPLYEQARKLASGAIPEGPFSGVPFLMKDLLASVANVRMCMGTALLKGYVSGHDSELTSRYKKSGLIILGKTNTPELGLLPTTEPRLFGATRNPWNQDRTAGGSSGGSAAAVASGMVAMAHANDGGGSIRTPASCCGVFGLKPTRARNSLGPDFGDLISGMVCEHVLTRSVRDSAAMLDVTAGPTIGDPYWAPPKQRPYLHEVGADPGQLRVSCAIEFIEHSDCKQAVAETIRLLEGLGHIVESKSPDLSVDQEDLEKAIVLIWFSSCAATIDRIMKLAGISAQPNYFEPFTWYMYQRGKEFTASEYLRSIGTIQRVGRDIAEFHRNYDVMLTSVLSQPPVPIGTFDIKEGENPADVWKRVIDFTPITALQNSTGQPAMSVPLFWNNEGLPIGIHFSGRFGDEATLFRLAAQLEAAKPWAGRRPL